MPDNPRVLIVEGRFYEDVADKMASGAIARLDAAGVDYERLPVPGVFEVPGAIRMALKSMEAHSGSNTYAGYLALGCVIRGETDHYDHVCREASRALMNLTLDYTIALGFGILTCETKEQADKRASIEGKNKGGDVAEACLRMMDVKRHFRLIQR